jgi:hypothetical protein
VTLHPVSYRVLLYVLWTIGLEYALHSAPLRIPTRFLTARCCPLGISLVTATWVHPSAQPSAGTQDADLGRLHGPLSTTSSLAAKTSLSLPPPRSSQSRPKKKEPSSVNFNVGQDLQSRSFSLDSSVISGWPAISATQGCCGVHFGRAWSSRETDKDRTERVPRQGSCSGLPGAAASLAPIFRPSLDFTLSESTSSKSSSARLRGMINSPRIAPLPIRIFGRSVVWDPPC